MTLRPVRGHVRAREALARARREGTVPPTLLVHGAPGIGKQRLALWTGQLLLCRDPGPAGPCGACKSCRLALNLEHPDLHWFFPLSRPSGSYTPDRLAEALEEARSAALSERREGLWSTHSDEVRGLYLAMARTVRRKAHRKPAMAPRQIFVVAEAEELVPQASSPEAANALLKLLEEPPEATWLVLTSSRPGRLLPTIRSRTFPLHLSRLPDDEVRAFLKDEAGADPEAAETAARLAQGSIGRALDYLPRADGEPGPLEEVRRAAFRILQAGLDGSAGARFSLAHGYGVSGARGLLDRFELLEEWLRDLAAAAAGRDDRIVHRDGRDYLTRMARERSISALAVAGALEDVEIARRRASGNVNPQLIVADLVGRLRDRLLGE